MSLYVMTWVPSRLPTDTFVEDVDGVVNGERRADCSRLDLGSFVYGFGVWMGAFIVDVRRGRTVCGIMSEWGGTM